MYVTGERTLIANGAVDSEALKVLAQQAMVINPTVEIYLLDKEGLILAHALPPESIQTERVDLQPVREIISDDVEMPLKGTDPRNIERLKVFSAAEVRHDGQLEGYLYAVLGGEKFDALVNDIRGSYVQRLSLWAIAAIAATAFLIGLLIIGLLTRRLTRLTDDVHRFTASDFSSATAVRRTPGDGDEIDRLGSAFAAMSDRIQDQFEQLKETDRLRRELVSNVSHDLRTPLASMQGYIETLLIKADALSPDERNRYLVIARKHAQRLGQLIGDLFELSKLEAASVQPDFESFSLAELLQDVAMEFELQAKQENVDIIVDTSQDGTVVFADIGLIQRVLENPLRNALEHTPHGGSITFSVARVPAGITVAVTDTGCGIADQDLPRIFDRYYRTERDETSHSSSVGLGLAIVERILDLHSSRITVVSQVDRGTRFEFALPTERAA